jgi:phage shock protein A
MLKKQDKNCGMGVAYCCCTTPFDPEDYKEYVMGVFSRFRDIINSNINSMLEKAEDPQKLLRLMIQEMEETLVELKSSCAAAMAETMKIRREWEQANSKASGWYDKARLAVEKNREDLAREALLEKRRQETKVEILAKELRANEGIIQGYKDDIATLEEKLISAKENQRIFIQRQMRARGKKRMRQDLRRAESSAVLLRFEEFEQRIERMEAEAELAGPWATNVRPESGQKPVDFTLEEKFAMLEAEDDINRDLAALRDGKDKHTILNTRIGKEE